MQVWRKKLGQILGNKTLKTINKCRKCRMPPILFFFRLEQLATNATFTRPYKIIYRLCNRCWASTCWLKSHNWRLKWQVNKNCKSDGWSWHAGVTFLTIKQCKICRNLEPLGNVVGALIAQACCGGLRCRLTCRESHWKPDKANLAGSQCGFLLNISLTQTCLRIWSMWHHFDSHSSSWKWNVIWHEATATHMYMQLKGRVRKYVNSVHPASVSN